MIITILIIGIALYAIIGRIMFRLFRRYDEATHLKESDAWIFLLWPLMLLACMITITYRIPVYLWKYGLRGFVRKWNSGVDYLYGYIDRWLDRCHNYIKRSKTFK